MLDRQTRELFAAGSNPLFESERRKIPWVQNASSLTMYRKRVWICVALVTLAVWIALTIYKYNDSDFQNELLLFAISISAIVMVIVDFFSTLLLSNYLHRLIRSKDWELLRLTPQNDDSILQAIFSIAQIRSWRPMVFEVAVRIATTELMLWGIVRFWISSHSTISDLFPFATFVFTPAGIAIYIYVIEPIWRMKAFAALSLAVVSINENATFADLVLFGATLLVHILQIGTLTAVWSYFGHRPDDYFGLEGLFCGIPIDLMLLICLTYAFYGYLKHRALNTALNRMFMSAA